MKKVEAILNSLNQKFEDKSVNDDETTCMRACLQFTGNFMVGNLENVHLISSLAKDCLCVFFACQINFFFARHDKF